MIHLFSWHCQRSGQGRLRDQYEGAQDLSPWRSADLLREKSAVNETQLATGALKHSPASVSLAVSGVLGPEEDEDGNPVGLVYFCCVGSFKADCQTVFNADPVLDLAAPHPRPLKPQISGRLNAHKRAIAQNARCWLLFARKAVSYRFARRADLLRRRHSTT